LLPEPLNLEGRTPRTLSLVPFSGIQFLDFSFNINDLGKSRLFRTKDAGDTLRLLDIVDSGDGIQYTDSEGSSLNNDNEDIIRINRDKALAAFEDTWLPLPFLKIKEETPGGAPIYDKGPLNWVRFRYVALPELDKDGNTHRLVLAVDTSLLKRYEKRPYAAPSPEDIPSCFEFSLVDQLDQIAWMHDSEWSKSIVENAYDAYLFRQYDERRYHARKEALGPFDIWAQFSSLVGFIAHAQIVPKIRFIDTLSNSQDEDIKVDLALDMGNSRTCGILIETAGYGDVDFNNSYSLELRDLSAAEHVYNEPFPSRIEFHREAFGNNRQALRSRADAFNWISPARVGWEATRLSYYSSDSDGITGLSSPKRYIWDTREQLHEWHYNSYGKQAGSHHEPAKKGTFFRYLTNSGEEWDQEDPNATVATRAKYSRSSMMMFYLAEIFSQTITHINSYGLRRKRPYSDVPRRLNRIILTMPTAMTVPERRLFERSAKLALKIIAKDYELPPEHYPELVMQWDEATGTQTVFLYNEIKSNYRGDMDLFFQANAAIDTFGNTSRKVRIASLDIGGGTTDLIITNYSCTDGSALTPSQELGEGFNIAGDDILRAIIEEHVIPALGSYIGSLGVSNPIDLLAGLLGASRANDDVRRSALQQQFALQVAIPCALKIIEHYETFDPTRGNQTLTLGLSDILSGDKKPHEEVSAFLRNAVLEAQGAGFDFDDIKIDISLNAVDNAVSQTIGPVLSDMCELIHLYNCDYLLISGRPSMMPAVRNTVLSKVPVSVDRVIPMSQYKVGDWYPFRNHFGYLEDPKTTAAVGAMVCALSEGHLQRFTLLSRNIELKSTVNFIGLLEDTGHVKDSNLYFRNINLDTASEGKSGSIDVSFKFTGPIYIGFRQLDVERWPATPLYKVEFRDPHQVRDMALPLTLTLGLIPPDEDSTFKVFDIQDIEDAEGNPRPTRDVKFTLQTTTDSQGHWTDTGAFTIVSELR